MEDRKVGVLIGLENRDGLTAVRVRSPYLPPIYAPGAGHRQSLQDSPAWFESMTEYHICGLGRSGDGSSLPN